MWQKSCFERDKDVGICEEIKFQHFVLNIILPEMTFYNAVIKL